jgi:hypothetical protein
VFIEVVHLSDEAIEELARFDLPFEKHLPPLDEV